ncbi:PAS domain-containing sensor histidine kinase [Haladaptatus sp. DJG-WS-42]|uniref:two-component system sensor histidine kinase NtrB n=1 Tax=Haladaptatus sp. DJG-WS-42 TaxID=3120516 RepID=UPI0030D4E799
MTSESIELYEQIVALMGDGVYVLDLNGRYVKVNDRFVELTGYDRENLLQKQPSILLDEAAVEQFEQAIQQLITTETNAIKTVEATITTASGDCVPLEATLTVLWEDGEAVGTIGVVRDITARKAREEKLKRQNERLEKFATVVTHDLRNPLNVAMGRLEIAKETGESRHFEAIANAQKRMERIIEDVLAVARQGEAVEETQPVTLDTVARRAWDTVDTGTATLVVDTDTRIDADVSRLTQLFENLFRNSVEHASTGEQPATNSANERSEEAVTVHVGRLDNDAGFYVEDTGRGIPPDKRERVFESGYTTDSEGTGFGLAIVMEIAMAHGWKIDVKGGTAGGARFEFTTEPTE